MPSRPEELEQVARRFHEHQLHDPLELVADLMCEDAEMVLLANNLEPVQGRPAILKALERGRDDGEPPPLCCACSAPR